MTLPILHASATNRWLSCARFASAEWPQGPSSDAAARGSRVHGGIATALGKAGVLLGPTSRDEEDLVAAGVAYAGKVRFAYPTATMLVEETLRRGGVEGTVDLAFINGEEAILVDWKTGQRHAGYYDQCATYGVLLRATHPQIKRVAVHLVYVGLGEADTVELDELHLDEANSEIMAALVQRDEGDNDAKPGDWCQWCPAKMGCPAFAIEHKALDLALVPDVSLAQLLRLVDSDNAKEAHRFVGYAKEAIEKIEENLKTHARASGNAVNLDGGKVYRMSMNTRTTLIQSASTNSIFRAHGAADALEETASLSNARKILKNNKRALQDFEAALGASESLKITEYERWETK